MADPQVEITWTHEEYADGRIELGETLRGVASVYSDEAINCRGVLLWVGCKVHGSGTDEKVNALQESHIHQGPVPAGEWLKVGFEVRIPRDAPPTYRGRYVKCDWQAVLRIDIPMWFDRRFEFSFVVLPRARRSPGEDAAPRDQPLPRAFRT